MVFFVPVSNSDPIQNQLLGTHSLKHGDLTQFVSCLRFFTRRALHYWAFHPWALPSHPLRPVSSPILEQDVFWNRTCKLPPHVGNPSDQS